MTSNEALLKKFDELDGDIEEMLRRYRKMRRDRAALLEACKSALQDINDHGTDGCGCLMWEFETVNKLLETVIAEAESEE